MTLTTRPPSRQLSREKVRALLKLAKRGHGSTALRPPITWTIPPMLSLPKLRALLPENLSYAIIGGIVTTFYMPAHTTQDLDLLIVGELLDLLYAPNLPWIEATLHPDNTTIAPDGLRAIALPYLILLKLLARRNRDILDIEEMLQYCDERKISEIRSVFPCLR